VSNHPVNPTKLKTEPKSKNKINKIP